jgi:hypothetical protein
MASKYEDRPLCGFADSCVNCPFPDCILGFGAGKRQMKARAKIFQLKKKGLSNEEIADELGRTKEEVEILAKV